MSKISLKTEKRTVKGKKVKKLRREGLIPLNLFGKDIKSIALSAKFVDFKKVFHRARTTQVVYLELGDKEYPALVQNTQIHPVTRLILHVDLKKIDLKEKTEVEVPVEVVGELSVVKSGEADLILIQDRVLVECLPTKIPEKISIDISQLAGIGSEVRIKDLAQSQDYKYLGEPEELVMQIVEAKKEEIKVPEATSETPTEVATVEGQEKPTESGTKEGEAKIESTEEKKDK